MDFKNILTSAITAIVVVAVVSVLVGNQGVGAGTRFPSGLSADGTSPSTGEVRGTSFQLDNGAATTSMILDKVCYTLTSASGTAFYASYTAHGSLSTSTTSCL